MMVSSTTKTIVQICSASIWGIMGKYVIIQPYPKVRKKYVQST